MTGDSGPRVLVTGASGLIGYAVVQELLAEELSVTAIARHPLPGASWLSLDLTSDPWPQDTWDVVVHCAARIPTSFEGPAAQAAERENRVMDARAIELAGAVGAHLVYFSSASVFGAATGDIDEDTPASPRIGYSREKLATEVAISESGIPATIFRLVSPYGTRQCRPTVLRRFLDAALTGASLRYFGTGQRTQDFLHADDAAAAVVLAVKRGTVGRFLLASGSAISMRELAHLMVEVTNSTSPIESADVPDPEESRVIRYRINRIREQLGFVPRISLAEGLRAWAAARRPQLRAGAE